jgi:hypothetical protein
MHWFFFFYVGLTWFVCVCEEYMQEWLHFHMEIWIAAFYAKGERFHSWVLLLFHFLSRGWDLSKVWLEVSRWFVCFTRIGFSVFGSDRSKIVICFPPSSGSSVWSNLNLRIVCLVLAGFDEMCGCCVSSSIN